MTDLRHILAMFLIVFLPNEAEPRTGLLPITAVAPESPPLLLRAEAESIEHVPAQPGAESRKERIRAAISHSSIDEKDLATTGSGFFIDLRGSIITSNQLVDECIAVSIWPVAGDMVKATVIIRDAASGLALLRTDIVPPDAARLVKSEGALTRGPTYALGYPDTGQITSAPTLTAVNLLGSQGTAFSVTNVMFEGDVRAGTIGGILLDSGGGVIGVIVPNATQTYAATGIASQSIGLALPSEALAAFADTQGVSYRSGATLPLKPQDRLLADARRFMVQIGCWK